jgi:hypothetical protein
LVSRLQPVLPWERRPSQSHPHTAPERKKIGARLGAKHQPQHIEKLGGIRHIPASWIAKLLRLVFDTAALRGSVRCANVPGTRAPDLRRAAGHGKLEV